MPRFAVASILAVGPREVQIMTEDKCTQKQQQRARSSFTTSSQQELDRRKMATVAGTDQSCVAVDVPALNCCAFVQEDFEDLEENVYILEVAWSVWRILDV